MAIEGRVWKYGDDINTDLIFPGRYTYILMSESEMADHALEDAEGGFNREAAAGDIVVAGKNWGCGSSREQAVKALKARGVAAVICKSVARIYFRNALNEGLPVIVCPEACDALADGETAEVDFRRNLVVAPAGSFPFPNYPEYIQGMVDAGGLLAFVKKQLSERGKMK